MKFTVEVEPKDYEAFFGAMEKAGMLKPDNAAKFMGAMMEHVAANPKLAEGMTKTFASMAKGMMETAMQDPTFATRMVDAYTASSRDMMERMTGVKSGDAASPAAMMETAFKAWAPFMPWLAAFRPGDTRSKPAGKTAQP